MRHIILGGFEGQEYGRLVGMGEASSFSGEGPKKIDHAPCKTANRCERNLSARSDFGAAENILIRLLQSALGRENENTLSINALFEEMAHPLHTDGAFAASSGAGEEYSHVKGSGDDVRLYGGEEGFHC